MAKKTSKIKRKSKDKTNPLLVPVIVLGLLSAIIGSVFLFSAEPPFAEDSGLSLTIDDNFGVSFYNETLGLDEKNTSFSPLAIFLHVIEFDPAIVDAYQKNASGQGNLEDLISPDGIAVQDKRTLLFSNPCFHVFWNQVSNYIFEDSFPDEEYIEQVFSPMNLGTKIKNIGSPFAITGFSMIILSDSFNISVMPNLFEYNGSDILFFSSGFIPESTILSNNYQAIFESEFFVNGDKQLDITFNEVTFNRTEIWSMPIGYNFAYEISLEGQIIAEQYSSIPINFLEILLNVANGLNDLLIFFAES